MVIGHAFTKPLAGDCRSSCRLVSYSMYANVWRRIAVRRWYEDIVDWNGSCGRDHALQIPFNTLRPRQNGRRFADDTFKRIFLNENVRISIKISLKFVPKGPINNNPELVQIMAWRRSGDKPLSEPMMVRLPTHICVPRPQWVKDSSCHHCRISRAIRWRHNE